MLAAFKSIQKMTFGETQRLALLVVILSAFLIVNSRQADAQQASGQQVPVIEVFGDAKSDVMPDSVEFSARVSGSGKNAVAALKAFQESQGKFNTAVNTMLFEGLEVEFVETKIGATTNAQNVVAMAMMGGEEAVEADDDAAFTVHETARVRLGGLDKLNEDELRTSLSKLVDAIREGGGVAGQVKPNPFGMTSSTEDARYFISDPQAAVSHCEKEAMLAAERKAKRLAKLSGGKLGDVLSVSEETSPAQDDDQASLVMKMYGMGDDTIASFSSHTYGPIKVQVRLRVNFAIVR